MQRPLCHSIACADNRFMSRPFPKRSSVLSGRLVPGAAATRCQRYRAGGCGALPAAGLLGARSVRCRASASADPTRPRQRGYRTANKPGVRHSMASLECWWEILFCGAVSHLLIAVSCSLIPVKVQPCICTQSSGCFLTTDKTVLPTTSLKLPRILSI